ncbi:MAG: Flp pilus assembly protein CpaB [Planctomycetes bacterium]|nr:Flp pilus assembly protein CpaB [Planctomycetota bacterium]
MKSKAMIPLLLGVVVGLVAIKFGVDALQRAKGTPAETVHTLVARIDIPASVAVTPDMVTVVETPVTPLLPEGAFGKFEDIEGRVTAKAIPQGAVVAPANLAPPGTRAGIGERIEEGYRAVSVKIDETSAVGYQIQPGDYVDVIVVMKVRRNKKEETISRIILQRTKVAAVGQNLGAPTGNVSQKKARSITLLVRDADVPKLHLAQTLGKVTLAMRGLNDRLLATASQASSSMWDEDEQAAAPPSVDPLAMPGPDLFAGDKPIRRPGKSQPGPEEPKKKFEVVIFNGPIMAPGTIPVQRVTYEDRSSMRVVDVTGGRGGLNPVGSADSAEGLLRTSRFNLNDNRRSRLLDRQSGRRGWSKDTEEPKDREISEE